MIGSKNLDYNPRNVTIYGQELEKAISILSNHVEIIYSSRDPSVFVKHLEASQYQNIIRITPRHGRKIGRIKYINKENTEELEKKDNYTEIRIKDDYSEYIFRVITS